MVADDGEAFDLQGEEGELATLGYLQLMDGCLLVEMTHAMAEKHARGDRKASSDEGVQVAAWSRKTKEKLGFSAKIVAGLNNEFAGRERWLEAALVGGVLIGGWLVTGEDRR